MNLKISYKNSIEDMVAFGVFNIKNSPSSQKAFKIALFFIPFLILSLLVFYYFILSDYPIILVLCMLSFALLWFIFYPRIYYWKIKKAIIGIYRESNDILVDLTLTLNENGIIKETAKDIYKISWSNITKVELISNYILVYINSLNVFIIPLRIFKTSIERDSFLKYIYQNTNINKE